MNNLTRQHGTVILVVTFVVSIIAAIAVRMTGASQLSFARGEHSVASSHLQQALLSVESFAAWAIEKDAEEDKNNGRYAQNGTDGSYDHLQEAWAVPLNAPIDDVTTTAVLEDALSRFNLNQLQGKPTNYNQNGSFNERFTIAQQRFMRLIQTYPDEDISKERAAEITQAVIDWVDVDDTQTGLGGAESSYYASLDTPYRAANRLFTSVTELRQVKGVSSELYQYLESLLIALPNTVGFNINTAPLALMRTLAQQNVETPLPEEEALQLMSGRPSKDNAITNAYETIEGFLASDVVSQVFNTNPTFWPSSNGLRTGSEYFLLTVETQFLEYQTRQMSLLKRENTTTGMKTIIIKREKRLME